jgi:hypothetical protein
MKVGDLALTTDDKWGEFAVHARRPRPSPPSLSSFVGRTWHNRRLTASLVAVGRPAAAALSCRRLRGGGARNLKTCSRRGRNQESNKTWDLMAWEVGRGGNRGTVPHLPWTLPAIATPSFLSGGRCAACSPRRRDGCRSRRRPSESDRCGFSSHSPACGSFSMYGEKSTNTNSNDPI